MSPDPAAPLPRWRDAALPVEERVRALLAELSADERTALALGEWAPLTARGLPHPHYVDAGSGLRGVDGATAFPAGIALAASFDAALAAEYGAAVGAEVRTGGFSVLLGPTLDLARDPRGGRVPEGFGEDPHLTGLIGAAHVRGVQGNAVIAMLKHYVGYTAEDRRTGWGPGWQRGDAMDVQASWATLHDVHLPPFRAAVDAGAWAIMGSYNRLGGEYTCQNRELLELPRREWGWRGFLAPDFLFAVRDPAAALAAGLDVPGLGEPGGRTPEMLAAPGLPAGTSDAIAGRILRALIGSGLVDSPLPEAAAPSTAGHLDLARRAAVAGTVLLTNRDATLPLSADVRTLAVLGPAGEDALYTMGGAGAVDIDPARAISPLAGIRRRAGSAVRVVAAQGSWGDVQLPAVPAGAFTLPDGSGPGVHVERVAADGSARAGVEETVDFRAGEEDMRNAWPRRWATRLTSDRSGPHRLSLALAGRAVVRVDGEVVLAGSREAVRFIAGPRYALQAVVHLEAGVPVTVEIDYDIGPAMLFPPMGWAPELHLGWQQPDALIEEAVAAAAGADVAVVLVQAVSGEGMDRAGLALPGDQDELVARVAAANPRTVVVLNTPGAVLMPWRDEVAAVLQVWYPGEQFGAALADVLFGDAEPGGRLPLTFPRDPCHLPGAGDPEDVRTELRYDEGAAIGHRSPAVRRAGALFPFGHGLGYSTTAHEFTAARVVDGEVVLVLRAANRGSRPTVHVVQAYLELEGATDGAALAGVARVPLAAGESADVRVVLGPEALLRFDPGLGRRVVADGRHRLRVAADSADEGEAFTLEVTAGRPRTVDRADRR
ncbi:glycoside hydrolase family 3 C-terminal domain-containing protein [Blastococcus sp. HT6-4]|uniref:beta-glucosidase family protein n=1 Tax=Blastococcus montanus TaxID=3144973 RepID=UPI0032086C70